MKPMLAATVKSVDLLRFPLMASPKLDGVRAVVIRGTVMSRSMKPIPNMEVQDKFRQYEGLDGELISGDPTAKDVYRRTVSEVMAIGRSADAVQFMVFDSVMLPNRPYHERHAALPRTLALPQTVCRAVSDVVLAEEQFLTAGYEGVILRCPRASYKQGRSTLNEQGMLKLKRFFDDEALVVGVEEMMHNANPEFRDELGRAAHTSHQANMVPKDTLGALVCQWRGLEFRIGTGFSDALRAELWQTPPVGRLVKFKYLPIGMKDLPRHPVFLGFRDRRDT